MTTEKKTTFRGIIFLNLNFWLKFGPFIHKIKLTMPVKPDITSSNKSINQEKKGFNALKQSPPALIRVIARIKKKRGPPPKRSHCNRFQRKYAFFV